MPINLEQTRMLFERAGKPKEMCVFHGAPHCFWDTEWEGRVFEKSVRWLSEHF